MSSDIIGSGEANPWDVARSLDPRLPGFDRKLSWIAEAVVPAPPGVTDPFLQHARELIAAYIAAAAAKRCFG